jgi:hypothetical protein
MTDFQFLVFCVLAVACLAYCLWKTQSDWRRSGFGLAAIWGIAASLGAFVFVAFLLTSKALQNL